MRAILACGLVAAAATTGLAGIVNGDFSSPVPSNGIGGGWTSTHIDSVGGWIDIGGTHGGIFRLNDDGNSTSDPTVQQTLTALTPGRLYEISFEIASWYVVSAPPDDSDSFEALIGGVVVQQAGPTQSGVWETHSFQFAAVASSAELQFRAEANGSDNDFAIDGVLIRIVPTPGPLATGFAGLLLAGKRRR
jgi:hypothetical protein